MNNILKVILIGVSIALLAWLLPTTYHFVTTKKADYPFIAYSSLHNDFLIQSKIKKEIVYKDQKNNVFTQSQTDSLLPTFYYRQLASENRLPDTLLGVPVTPQLIRETNFFFHHTPFDVNVKSLKMYPLLESCPKRMELTMPDDICRFTDKEVQFIDMETNRVKSHKSALFQRIFEQKGVQLPPKVIAGNPTARKEYDEGYFFTDQNNQLFHLKQMVGRPYLKRVTIDTALTIAHIFVTEYPNRTSYAFITDTDNQMYVLTAPDYKLIKTEVPSFNPQTDNLLIIADMFSWNVKRSNEQAIINYALNASNYTLRDSIETPIITNAWQKAARYIFPVELQFTSLLNKFFSPHISSFSKQALILNILLAIAFFIYFREDDNKQILIIPIVSILIAGAFAFIPLWIFWRF